MLAWSPDGRMLASPSGDRLIHIWDAEVGEICNTIKFQSVESAIWSPDGQIFVSAGHHRKHGLGLQIWNPTDLSFQYSIKDTYAYTARGRLSWSPDSCTLAFWGYNSDVQLLDVRTGEFAKALKVPQKNRYNYCYGGVWSPNCKFFSLVTQNALLIWHIESGEVIAEIEGNYEWGSKASWSLDGEILAFGGSSKRRAKDYNVVLWNVTKQQAELLEGHTEVVREVAFSSDGRLLVTKAGRMVRFWRCDTWQLVTVFENSDYGSDISLNPQNSSFAILGEDDRAIHIWDVDTETLLDISSDNESIRYRNAKVVLIGDSSVGKSGLGMVLAGEEFKATKSTHGRHVWSLEAKHHKTSNNLWEIRETLLWDLAGQAEYRLVHQLSLDQINVALILFDGSSPTDPFKGVTFWNKALQ
jgi:WD40 repeat protein